LERFLAPIQLFQTLGLSEGQFPKKPSAGPAAAECNISRFQGPFRFLFCEERIHCPQRIMGATREQNRGN
jgi:hypothetical protein